MKIKHLLFVVFTAVFLSSCVTKVSLSENFYDQTKVGVIVKVDSINRFKSGSQGLLDMAISSGAKYKKALQYIGSEVDPKSMFLNATQEKLVLKNKPYLVINDNLDFKAYEKFEKPSSKEKLNIIQRI